MCGYRVGIDIGGTFTDLVALNEETGELTNIKLSSTPRSPADGVITAFQHFLKNKKATNVTVLSHATTIAGGFGGKHGSDGVDAIHSHMTNTMNTPIEAIEPVCPFRFMTCQMRVDSAGPGKWRGGVGIERSWVLEAPSATLSILAERNNFPPWGLFRGKPAATGEYYITKTNGKKTRLRSKCTVGIAKGDRLIVRTPSGGGYGDPLEREASMVLDDVANGLVSLKSARDDYGVVIRRTLVVDQEATDKLRKKTRREHKAR
jgi:N-methylhydantoinase B